MLNILAFSYSRVSSLTPYYSKMLEFFLLFFSFSLSHSLVCYAFPLLSSLSFFLLLYASSSFSFSMPLSTARLMVLIWLLLSSGENPIFPPWGRWCWRRWRSRWPGTWWRCYWWSGGVIDEYVLGGFKFVLHGSKFVKIFHSSWV